MTTPLYPAVLWPDADACASHPPYLRPTSTRRVSPTPWMRAASVPAVATPNYARLLASLLEILHFGRSSAPVVVYVEREIACGYCLCENKWRKNIWTWIFGTYINRFGHYKLTAGLPCWKRARVKFLCTYAMMDVVKYCSYIYSSRATR